MIYLVFSFVPYQSIIDAFNLKAHASSYVIRLNSGPEHITVYKECSYTCILSFFVFFWSAGEAVRYIVCIALYALTVAHDVCFDQNSRRC